MGDCDVAQIERLRRFSPEDGIARQEAGGIELWRQRHDAVQCDEAVTWSIAVDALHLGWTTDGTASVAADCQVEPGVACSSGTWARGRRARVLVAVCNVSG